MPDPIMAEHLKRQAEKAAREPVYFVGLDLGQSSDPSALTILCRTTLRDEARPERKQNHYACRHLRRWPLGTDYTHVIDDIKTLFATAPLADLRPRASLVVDHTGVGRPIVDMLKHAEVNAQIVPVQITSGTGSSPQRGGGWNVAKVQLVSTLLALFQQRRFRIAENMKLGPILAKELANFKVKITPAANEVFGEWRNGEHDDLVLAAAIAAWVGEQQRRLAIFC